MSLEELIANDYAKLRSVWTLDYEYEVASKRYRGSVLVERMIEALEYLKGLCLKANISFDLIDALPYRVETDRFHHLYVRNKKKINELFSKDLLRLQAIRDAKIDYFTTDIEIALREQYEHWESTGLDRLASRKQNALLEIEEYQGAINSLRTNIATIEQVLSGKTSLEKVDIVGGLTAAFRAVPFFKFKDVSRGWLKLETTADCILTEKNPSAGINHSFNFGRFEVNLSLTGLDFRVYTLKPNGKNTFSDKYFHPHVSREGKVCWGNAWDRVSRAREDGDFITVFRIIAALITSYSPESPYRALYSWVAEAEAREQKKEQPPQAEEETFLGVSIGRSIANELGRTRVRRPYEVEANLDLPEGLSVEVLQRAAQLGGRYTLNQDALGDIGELAEDLE